MKASIPGRSSRLKTVFISSLAIILEWYDFSIFGFYAIYISKLFFPFENQTTSIITTFIIFGVSFLFRPLGALIISNIGDRLGRRIAFITTAVLMTFPTVLIGLLPTFHQIGIAATVLIIVLRILQGLSLGGERSSSLSLLVELAPSNLRGFYASFTGFSTTTGILLSSAVCGFVSSTFTHEEMISYGWRIPFLLGAFTGLIAYFLRRYLRESAKYLEIKRSGRVSLKPVSESLKNYWKQILITLFGTLVFAVSFYIIFVYLITFAVTIGDMELSSVLKINTINLAICTALVPVTGYLSDKIGRRPLMLVGALGILVTSLLVFEIFSGESLIYKFIIQLLCGVMIVIYGAALFAFMVELFPTRIRMTALSLGHVVSFSIFGGSAPFISSYLISKTGNIESPGIYLGICSIISLLFILSSRETYKTELE